MDKPKRHWTETLSIALDIAPLADCPPTFNQSLTEVSWDDIITQEYDFVPLFV